jgi:hypothetical protein
MRYILANMSAFYAVLLAGIVFCPTLRGMVSGLVQGFGWFIILLVIIGSR